jgi:3-oxoacyl-[acyl-carrier protein] reductase
MRIRYAFFAGLLACVAAISCASPPKPAPEPQPAPAPAPAPAAPAPEPAPSPKVEAPAPDELKTKASELRKRAFDLGIKDVAADEYAAADKAWADGNAAYGKDNAASAASYTDAIARFQAAIDKGLPLIADREEQNAAKLRDVAVGKGAESLYGDLFAYAEARLAKARESKASGDYETAIASFRASSKDYDVLYKLCDAKTWRDKIEARDFAKWDPSNWSIAQTKHKAAQDLLQQDAKAAGESIDEAILRYGIAWQTALEFYSADRKRVSETERDRASGIKAQVAVKDEYAAALALFDQAETARNSKDYESSFALYDKATSAFSAAYAHAKAKMDGARDELSSLDDALATKQATLEAAR